ncbi:MAG TPA: DUF2795 domain-containing protein [Myxococcaceae bacterium]|nr:DUF2795 domain-containing protein [Myxococcaceae bacterium]
MATELDVATAADVERDVGQVYPLAKQVSEALMGAVFPLRRDHVVWVARENEASPTLLTLISALPDRTYRSLDEVQEAVDQGLSQSDASV